MIGLQCKFKSFKKFAKSGKYTLIFGKSIKMLKPDLCLLIKQKHTFCFHVSGKLSKIFDHNSFLDNHNNYYYDHHHGNYFNVFNGNSNFTFYSKY